MMGTRGFRLLPFLAAACLLVLGVGLTEAVTADEIRPALLEITEHEGGRVDVTWKKPALGDRALALEPVRLDALVREVVALYQQGDSATDFDLDLCDGPPGLAADSGRLRQMLHNLIRNAREAAGESAPTISIRSRVDRNGTASRLWLELHDDGPGFPRQVLENPFEPYVTSKPSGSGLGLAICRKIVAEHNGEISIENPAEGGARVVILLPLAAGETGA